MDLDGVAAAWEQTRAVRAQFRSKHRIFTDGQDGCDPKMLVATAAMNKEALLPLVRAMGRTRSLFKIADVEAESLIQYSWHHHICLWGIMTFYIQKVFRRIHRVIFLCCLT